MKYTNARSQVRYRVHNLAHKHIEIAGAVAGAPSQRAGSQAIKAHGSCICRSVAGSSIAGSQHRNPHSMGCTQI